MGSHSTQHDGHEALRRALPDGTSVPDVEWAWFVGQTGQSRVAKGGLLFAEGETLDRAYYLIRGIVRYFARGRDREITFGFDYEGRFASDVDAFFGGRPAMTSAEALEDLDAIAVRRQTMEEAFDRHPCWERLGRRLVEGSLLRRVDKERRIRMLTAEERYQLLLDQGSPLALRLPLYHLAAYLGIAPETLSRIRARM